MAITAHTTNHDTVSERFKFDLGFWLQTLLERIRPKPSSDSISFLASLCLHVAIILALAFITLSSGTSRRTLLFSFSDVEMGIDTDAFELAAPGAEEESKIQGDMQANAESAVVLDVASANSLESLRDKSTDLAEIESLTTTLVPAELASLTNKVAATQSSSQQNLFSGNSMEGRSPANRGRMALKNGGSKESEQAVDAALDWFAAHQAYDGSWSMDMADRPCNGRCSHGTIETGSAKRISATGLALLCYLGAGHTHKEGKYRDEVSKGLAYLTKNMGREGRFVREDFRYEMYEHGIASLSLSEACEMTGDTSLLPSVRAAIDFMIRAQHADGSWGYVPNASGDLSIVGWQMMALKSASKIGVRVDPKVIERVDAFMDGEQSDYGSYYGYRSSQRDPCMTSIGLLLRLYRGWPRSDPRIIKGADYVADLGPSTNGIYYNYYASQLLFHLKHSDWEDWNRMNRDYLVREQSRDGHSKGSWYIGKSHFNQVGGRLYCTAMATLSLEVYYRFMPIYDEIRYDDFAL